MEDDEGRVRRRLGSECRQVVDEVAAHEQRRVGRGDCRGRPQPGASVRVLRPDERVEPRDVGRVGHVERVQVQAGAPHHVGQRAGQRRPGGCAVEDGLAGAESECRRTGRSSGRDTGRARRTRRPRAGRAAAAALRAPGAGPHTGRPRWSASTASAARARSRPSARARSRGTRPAPPPVRRAAARRRRAGSAAASLAGTESSSAIRESSAATESANRSYVGRHVACFVLGEVDVRRCGAGVHDRHDAVTRQTPANRSVAVTSRCTIPGSSRE